MTVQEHTPRAHAGNVSSVAKLLALARKLDGLR
jgi:hypothetical protein